LFIAALLVIVFVLGSLLFRKETIVTIQPFTLTDEAWVAKDNASTGYKESWGFALAQLLGNVTPASVDFIKQRIEGLLSPAIYSDVINILEVQARQIKRDGVTMRFEPRFVEYEPESNKVFVYGYSYTKGLSNDIEKRDERTYEFKIQVSNYLPVINYVNTYSDRPRTERVLERMRKIEERQSGEN
jgi:conjugal transfer pilus assembly protein TraE